MNLIKPKSVTPIKEIKGVCIHHTKTPMKRITKSYEIRKVRAMQQYHMTINKWSDIAFNFVVGQTGNIYEGRGIDIRPASQSTKYGNDHYLSIAWLGNHRTMNPTDKALEGINLLITDLETIYGMDMEVKTHKEFKKVSCPGTKISSWVKKGRPIKNASYDYDEVLENIAKAGYYIDE